MLCQTWHGRAPSDSISPVRFACAPLQLILSIFSRHFSASDCLRTPFVGALNTGPCVDSATSPDHLVFNLCRVHDDRVVSIGLATLCREEKVQ